MDSTTHNYKKLLRRFLAVGLTLMMILGGTIGVLAEEGGAVTEVQPWTLSGGTLAVNTQAALKDYAYGGTPWVSANPAFIMDKLFVTAEKELLYHEKASGSELYGKDTNNGDKNYTKYTYELKYNEGASYIYYPSEWCDAFVDWCMWSTYGSWKARDLICGPFNGYTPSSSSYYKNKKQWYTKPMVGDQVFFQGPTRINHTGIVIKVTDTHVYTIEGNAINRVRKRVYPLGTSAIAGYGRPRYDAPAAVEHPADAIKSVQIASGITKVGDWAFANCTANASAKLPEGLKQIGNYAFYNNYSLKNVNLPSTLTTIGDAAFQNTAIGSAWLPDSVTSIGHSAFFGCQNLVEVVIPEGVKKIEEYTFMGCENLVSVRLPASLTSIQLSAFAACDRLANIVFAGTQSQWNAVQKLAEDNGGGKYNLTQTIHFNGAQKVSGYYDVFTDDWFGADVTYVKDRGLMNGTGEGVFEPGTGASRGMVVTILYRLAGSPAAAAASTEMVPLEEETEVSIGSEPANEADVIQSEAKDPEEDSSAAPQNDNDTEPQNEDNTELQNDNIAPQDDSIAPQDDTVDDPDVIRSEEMDLTGTEEAASYAAPPAFKDVESGAWYSAAVAWAHQNGIVNGYEDNRFGPNDPVTRQQLATILYRYAKMTGADAKADGSGVNLSKYKDANEIGDYAVDALKWVNAAKIMTGTSETTLEPAGKSNRAQLAAVLHRFCNLTGY